MEEIRLCYIDGEALMAKRSEPTAFCIDSLLPQGLSVLGGDPKTGKSWLVLDWSVHIAKGEPVVDGTDGYFDFNFDTEFNKKPKVNEDGTVDYWSIHAVEVVEEGQVIAIDIPNLDAESLGVAGLDITTEDKATAAIDRIGDAINQLSAVRAKIGAYANRIEHTITNLDTTEENMTASYSQIMDVDMAKEMTEYSTVQVLVQASTSVLAQANERPQQVLQLLQ